MSDAPTKTAVSCVKSAHGFDLTVRRPQFTRRSKNHNRARLAPTFARLVGAGSALRTLLLGVSLSIAVAGTAEAESRVALVIGNGGYQNVPALANPPNDARDVAQALSALGFKVKLLVDADRATFEKEVIDFGREAVAADVSLFYYGGHGLQVAGHNYLLPVDASLHRVEDIDGQTVALDAVLDSERGGSGVHLVFLDACRDDPTRNSKTPIADKPGLARVRVGRGFYIGFATDFGAVALDGAGRNSPFADALLHHIAEPGLEVYDMMIEVRNDVDKTTGHEQSPVDEISLTRQFYFKGDATAKAAPETRLWQVAAAQRDRSLAAIYLDIFPNGAHARDLQAMLPSLAEARAAAADTAHEDEYWDLALSIRARSLADVYVERFPKGTHLEDAKSLLSNLRSAEMAASEAPGVCERLATHPSDATSSVAGVDFKTLAEHAPQAVEACGLAVNAHPENAHYLALLARATFAAGRETEGVALYRKAVAAGDTRAMVSLATLMENGDHVGKDTKGAFALYEKAVARDNPDAAINLGFALAQGLGVPKNMPRALALFRKASDLGSARATFDLATLVSQGVGGGKPAEALDLFRKAADLGYPGAYRAAALLLDVGKIVPRNVDGAADALLECVRADFGDCLGELTGRTQVWSFDMLRALQSRLKTVGYYAGPIDGKSGPTLAPALQQWRVLGPPKKA